MSNRAGKALKTWRLAQRPRLSQTAAAKLVKTEQATWSRWETGKWRPEGAMRRALKVVTGLDESTWDDAEERALLRRAEKTAAAVASAE